jgi:DNA sulfur modification protein DndC
MRHQSLWDNERLTMEESIQLTIDSLCTHGAAYRHWAVAYSGGKDSTAVVTMIAHFIEAGLIPTPESLTVLYADTRMELPPLQAAALSVLDVLGQRGMNVQVVLPALDKRFYVYMFGRGVPPPKNRFRWCTPNIKVEPMNVTLDYMRSQYDEKFLMLTGVRQGESAARDQRIAFSCSKNGGECGQGWLQVNPPKSVADVLAPCLHWRVCHIWDWLTFHASTYGFSTQVIAQVYGGDEKEEVNARTGCIGCNLASKDTALDTILKIPDYQYLAPLKRIKPLYQELLRPTYRLRKNGEDRRKDGELAAHPMRMGPLTMEARRYGLSTILGIQEEINTSARIEHKPCIDLINSEEHERIIQLIEANTWPERWTGDEVRADEWITQIIGDGISQPIMWGREVTR